jgi:hypothetical protein
MPRGYKGRVVSYAEASRRWRERNPEKAKHAQRNRSPRKYDPLKSKMRREKRFTQFGYRERINRMANNHAIMIRRWLDAYKLRIGCVDCGYREHATALHFDHTRGVKLLNVCNAKSIAQAQAEIAKCEVRCANCHAIKSFEQLQKRTYERVNGHAK